MKFIPEMLGINDSITSFRNQEKKDADVVLKKHPENFRFVC